MFYQKSPKASGAVIRSRVVSDYSKGISTAKSDLTMPFDRALSSAGFDCVNGDLLGTIGISLFSTSLSGENVTYSLSNGEKILAVFHFNRFDRDATVQDDRLVFFSESGKLYGAGLYRNCQPAYLGFTFTSRPCAINYRLNGEDVLILSSATDGMLAWDGANPPYAVEDAPRLTSLCVHYERIFATASGDRSAVWFSDDLDVTNWNVSLSEAGFIELADEGGALLRAVEFGDHVYVFRTYGISRLTAYAEQENFRMTKLFTSGGKLLPDTICVCGDRIIFLTEDGLFAFDGYDTMRIDSAIDGFICAKSDGEGRGATDFTACYSGGKYYLVGRFDFDRNGGRPSGRDAEAGGGDGGEYNGGVGNNGVMVYDVLSRKTTFISGVKPCFVGAISGEDIAAPLICLCEGEGGGLATFDLSGSVMGERFVKFWKTPFGDFGRGERIAISAVELETSGSAEVICENEYGEKRRVTFTPRRKTAKCRLKGKRFRFEIRSREPQIRIGELRVVTEKFTVN